MTIQFTKQNLGSSPDVGDLSRVLSQMQDKLGDIFAEQNRLPASSRVLLQNVSLASGSNQIAHTLGKTLTGWTLTRVRANATVYDAQDTQPLPSTYLTLVASAPCVVDVMVF